MSVGSDLLLLAVDRKSGHVRSRPRLGIALVAADLVELVLAGCVALRVDRLIVLSQDVLDGPAKTTLRALAESAAPATIVQSLSGRSVSAVDVHLRHAEQAGILRREPPATGKGFGSLRIFDEQRARDAAQRFAAATRTPGEPGALDNNGLADLALAMLADAVGLTGTHLKGWPKRKAKVWLAVEADRRSGQIEPERSVRNIVRAARRRIEQTPERPADGPVPVGEGGFDASRYMVT